MDRFPENAGRKKKNWENKVSLRWKLTVGQLLSQVSCSLMYVRGCVWCCNHIVVGSWLTLVSRHKSSSSKHVSNIYDILYQEHPGKVAYR